MALRQNMQIENCYTYRLDPDSTGMMLSGEVNLRREVTQYLVKRVTQLASKSGYSRFRIVPGFGKKHVVLIEGNV